MTFIFEDLKTDDYFYVNAPDLYHAITIFRDHYDTDESKYHIYVRIA